MRIVDFHIDGFGHFAGADVGPFDSPVTVFFGPNEAGKSTYLQFIRTILFGFPSRRGGDFYPPQRGGSHGGRITLATEDGAKYIVQRTQGRGVGPVTLRNSAGEALNEAMLAGLLGHHGKDVFENVFAFTLDELHSEGLLKDESVNSQIYSAGMGATNLPAVLKQLKSNKDSLFRKGGSKQKIAEVNGRLSEVDSKLREVANNAETYGARHGRLREVEASLEDLRKRRDVVQSQLGRQRQVESAWGHWSDLNETERQLDDLPVVSEFPIDGVTRLESSEQRLETAQREDESAQVQVEKARAEADVEIVHRDILDHAPAIRELERGRTAFDASVRDLPRREAEIRGYQGDLEATLSDLGPEWDENRLEQFDLSISVQEEISRFQDQMRDMQGELARLESTRSQTERELGEATEERDRAEQALSAAAQPELDAKAIARHRGLIASARSKLGEIDGQRRNASNLEAQIEGLASSVAPAANRAVGGPWPAASAATIGIALIALGAALGGATLLLGLVAGLALIAVGAYLYLSGVRTGGREVESPLAAGVRESLRRADREKQDLTVELERDAASLGLSDITEPTLSGAEQRLSGEERRIGERDRLAEDLKNKEMRADTRQRRMDEAEEASKRARQQLDDAQQGWREWLQERGLRDNFTPQTAAELRGKVETGRTQLLRVRDSQERIAKIKQDIDRYVDGAEPLAAAFGFPLSPRSPGDAGSVVDRLSELLAEVRARERARTAAEARLSESEEQLAERRRERDRAESQIGDLLKAGDADDSEDFRQRAELSARRSALEATQRDALGHLRRLGGSDEALETLKVSLAATDPQRIAEEIRALEEEGANTDSDISQQSTELGSIQQELQGLIGEEASSALRMERYHLLEQMRDYARQWARLTLAEKLLDEARGKFERERQPGVVRHAGSFFRKITDERYQQVFAPLGEQTITVTDADGHPKQPSELSRGTREQLFLSLRFGLIRDSGEQTEPLPVVVDEVLVNFDPERALRAASAFVELSQTNQVLVFTCHPEIVTHFQNAAAMAGAQDPEVVTIG